MEAVRGPKAPATPLFLEKDISSFPNHIAGQATNHVAASVAPAAALAERVAGRRDARRRAAQLAADETTELLTEQLASASAAGDAAEELPDPPTPGYELLYTPGHGHHEDGADDADVHPVADPKQAALPFHHIDVRA